MSPKVFLCLLLVVACCSAVSAGVNSSPSVFLRANDASNDAVVTDNGESGNTGMMGLPKFFQSILNYLMKTGVLGKPELEFLGAVGKLLKESQYFWWLRFGMR